jgi:hypothetical protein
VVTQLRLAVTPLWRTMPPGVGLTTRWRCLLLWWLHLPTAPSLHMPLRLPLLSVGVTVKRVATERTVAWVTVMSWTTTTTMTTRCRASRRTLTPSRRQTA